jgi:hypothetical protein
VFRPKVKTYFRPELQFELNRWQSQTIQLATATKNQREPTNGVFVGFVVSAPKTPGRPKALVLTCSSGRK